MTGVGRVAKRVIPVAFALLLLAGCGPHNTAEQGEPVSRPGANRGEPAQSGAEATGIGSAGDAGAQVHPTFALTGTELEELVAELSPETRERISERPQYFLELVDQALARPEFATILVDKQHPLPSDYVPRNLVNLDRFRSSLSLNKEQMELRAEVVPWLTAMSRAAAIEGIALPVSSAYRSYAYQDNLFAYWTRELGEEEAARVSARPGNSQHQLGTTVDFGSITLEFAQTEAFRWLTEHAWRFGFSLSYPEGYEEETGYSYEPWHYRYLTPEVARLEREFFDGIQQRMLEFLNSNRDRLERVRQ